MDELTTALEIIRSQRNWSIVGNIFFFIGLLTTFFWQHKRIVSLQEKLDLWEPTRLREEASSWLKLQTDLHRAIKKNYELEIQQAEDDVKAVERIMKELLSAKDQLTRKLIRGEPFSPKDMLLPESFLKREESKGHFRWTVQFNNTGVVKTFKFPIEDQKKAKESEN